MFKQKEAEELLTLAFYYLDEEDPKAEQTLNMNDTWAWAFADGEYVPDECLPEVAELFWRYGYAGILYWVSVRNDNRRSEFLDINRFIEFVRQEEHLRAIVPDSSERAYAKITYTLGVKNDD